MWPRSDSIKHLMRTLSQPPSGPAGAPQNPTACHASSWGQHKSSHVGAERWHWIVLHRQGMSYQVFSNQGKIPKSDWNSRQWVKGEINEGTNHSPPPKKCSAHKRWMIKPPRFRKLILGRNLLFNLILLVPTAISRWRKLCGSGVNREPQ